MFIWYIQVENNLITSATWNYYSRVIPLERMFYTIVESVYSKQELLELKSKIKCLRAIRAEYWLLPFSPIIILGLLFLFFDLYKELWESHIHVQPLFFLF